MGERSGWRSSPGAQIWTQSGLESQARRVEKDELLRLSDVVTVHTVLSPETTGLIDAAALALMKPTAYLVNTSRGPVVREDHLVAALRSRSIVGAALDAYDMEPLANDHAFRELDELILAPHIGYVTRDVYADFYNETVRSCTAFLHGQPIRLLGTNSAPTAAAHRRYEDT